MKRSASGGFTLIELAMVVVVMGLVLTIEAAGFGRHTDQMLLRGATELISQRLRLTRDRAVATNVSQTMQFQAGYQGSDYRVEIGGVTRSGWTLAKRSCSNMASPRGTATGCAPRHGTA